jgi:DNA-directed RNA polymerase specialized sigma subunit, sigma24 homolog
MRTPPSALNHEQATFAQQHHDLLLAFLGRYHLEESEYYGALAERYLTTVVQYLTDPKLRKYAFSTILWYRLRYELAHLMRAHLARPPSVADVDVAQMPYQDDLTTAELESMWRNLQRTLTQKELNVLFLRQYGYSYREIGAMCRCSENAVKCRFSKLRKRLKKTKENEL